MIPSLYMEAQSICTLQPQTTRVNSVEELSTSATETSKNATKNGKVRLHDKMLPRQNSDHHRSIIKSILQTQNASWNKRELSPLF